MSVCITCLGRIDAHAYEVKQKIAAKLYPGKPVKPPKRCTECTWLTLLKFANEDDEEPMKGEADGA